MTRSGYPELRPAKVDARFDQPRIGNDSRETQERQMYFSGVLVLIVVILLLIWLL